MNVKEFQAYILTRTNIGTNEIKGKVFRYGLKEQRCEECGVTDSYNNKPIVLQLHHIDGNNSNNILKNFQILCPNCHSQTNTFRSKKKLTEQEIIEACKDSATISDVIAKLKKHPSGHLYKVIEQVIKKNGIPITKYNYTTNSVKHKPAPKQFSNCLYCGNEFLRNGIKKYCNHKCKVNANIKHIFDMKIALELIRQKGWLQAAKDVGINTKWPDANLRLRVKNYIKNVDPSIDFYSLSKYSHHSRYK